MIFTKIVQFQQYSSHYSRHLEFHKDNMVKKLILVYVYASLTVESIKTNKLPKALTSINTEPSSQDNTSYPHIYITFNSNFLPNPSSWDFIFLDFYCLGCVLYGGTNRIFFTFLKSESTFKAPVIRVICKTFITLLQT